MTENFQPISRNFAESLLFIKTEQVDGARIGRTDLPIETLNRCMPSKTAFELARLIDGSDSHSTRLRESILFTLNNNTHNPTKGIGHERAVSAYFTYNPDPEDEKVIVEWGTINPDSKEAKLHNFLNRGINFAEWSKRGMRISSGHLARLSGTNQYLALFDNLCYGTNRRDLPLQAKKTINTLHVHGIITITADGHIQLPVF